MTSLYVSKVQPRDEDKEVSLSSLLAAHCSSSKTRSKRPMGSKSLNDALSPPPMAVLLNASLTSLSAPFANIILANNSSSNNNYATRCKALKESVNKPVKDHRRRRPSLAEEDFEEMDGDTSTCNTSILTEDKFSISCSFRLDNSISDRDLENLDELGVSLSPNASTRSTKTDDSEPEATSSQENKVAAFFHNRAQTFSRNLETIGLLLMGKRVMV
ncbi:expressed unknown protein [Seminavis robusta]|uniref:Uncharacterized protein n=1 Tax=Seminavis robusta TaxID=568900 RepID=A0A9N8DEW4_9STRA|nr:expressed unknown protein [Seminavis robusta]|eukprot:Sro38_g023550.1 n/a (216) ;mRNA; f:10928-11575